MYTDDNVSLLLCVVVYVRGVTQLRDTIYLVCALWPAIWTVDAKTLQTLRDIDVRELMQPDDIAVCEKTSCVYVADFACVWRVSSDGGDIQRWLQWSPPDTFRPLTLSVTSSRLLVTSRNSNQLTQFDSFGDELRLVDLPDDMKPHHAIETTTGTFIISHENTKLKKDQVSEVNTGGQVLRQFSGSRLLPLSIAPLSALHIAVDSQGNIFVADRDNHRISVLNSKLVLRRIIINECIEQPLRLCCMKQSGQLLVGDLDVLAVFNVLHCRQTVQRRPNERRPNVLESGTARQTVQRRPNVLTSGTAHSVSRRCCQCLVT